MTDDVRVLRTKQMIKTAFFELMKTEGFEKINIRTLTEKAMINRSTFYLHYTDKFDLLNQIENESLEGLKKILMDMPADVLITKGFENPMPLAVLCRAFEYIKDNHEFFKLITGNPTYVYKLSEMIKEVLTRKHMKSQIAIPERYALAIIVGIQTSMIGEWLKGGMKESPDEIVNILSSILKDMPKNLLQQVT